MVGDVPGQPAYDNFSIERTFLRIKFRSLKFKESSIWRPHMWVLLKIIAVGLHCQSGRTAAIARYVSFSQITCLFLPHFYVFLLFFFGTFFTPLFLCILKWLILLAYIWENVCAQRLPTTLPLLAFQRLIILLYFRIAPLGSIQGCCHDVDWSGHVMSTPFLPEIVPDTDANPVSFNEGKGQRSVRFEFRKYGERGKFIALVGRPKAKFFSFREGGGFASTVTSALIMRVHSCTFLTWRLPWSPHELGGAHWLVKSCVAVYIGLHPASTAAEFRASTESVTGAQTHLAAGHRV